MYYPQPYSPNEEEEQELEAIDVTLYDRIESQWTTFFESSLLFCTLSISTSVALLLRAFGATPIVFLALGIAVITVAILAVINWSELNQRLKTRLLLCLLAASVAIAIVTTDAVVDWVKLNPLIINRIVNVSAIVATVVISLVFVALVGKVKNAYQK